MTTTDDANVLFSSVLSSINVFPREEVDAAFRRYWQVGNVEERWSDWADCFTEDVVYDERVYGTMNGRETVRAWITSTMAQHGHIHGALNWYVIEGNRVAYGMDNTYYNPAGPDAAPITFGGMSQIIYAGDSLFGYEEDYWDVSGAKKAYKRFAKLLEEHGDRWALDTAQRAAARKLW